jgi:hypothetical protein
MKKTDHPPVSPRTPTEAEIREYAHELYIKSGWISGRDLDNWLEAEAYLRHHPKPDPTPELLHAKAHGPSHGHGHAHAHGHGHAHGHSHAHTVRS